MDSDAERLAHLRSIIDRQIDEIERLRRRPAWMPFVGAFAVFVVGGGLVELVRHLI